MNAVVFPHESIEDLIADKLLATKEHTGRERFKDVYDLMLLLDLSRDRTLINDKLALIAGRTKRDAGEPRRADSSAVLRHYSSQIVEIGCFLRILIRL